MIIFAGTQGLLDDVAVSDIRTWEAEFYDFIRASHPDLGSAIRESGQLTDETRGRLIQAVEEFKGYFAASRRGEEASRVAAAAVGG